MHSHETHCKSKLFLAQGQISDLDTCVNDIGPIIIHIMIDQIRMKNVRGVDFQVNLSLYHYICILNFDPKTRNQNTALASNRTQILTMHVMKMLNIQLVLC